VCSLVKGGLRHPSWRSTAERTPGWLGSSRKGRTCCSSLVGWLQLQPLPLCLVAGHWLRSTGPGCSRTGRSLYPLLGFLATSWIELNTGRVNDRE